MIDALHGSKSRFQSVLKSNIRFGTQIWLWRSRIFLIKCRFIIKLMERIWEVIFYTFKGEPKSFGFWLWLLPSDSSLTISIVGCLISCKAARPGAWAWHCIQTCVPIILRMPGLGRVEAGLGWGRMASAQWPEGPATASWSHHSSQDKTVRPGNSLLEQPFDTLEVIVQCSR